MNMLLSLSDNIDCSKLTRSDFVSLFSTDHILAKIALEKNNIHLTNFDFICCDKIVKSTFVRKDYENLYDILKSNAEFLSAKGWSFQHIENKLIITLNI